MQKAFFGTIGLVLILCGVAAIPANAQMGIAGGVVFSELGDITAGDHTASLKRVPGWHVHLWVNLPLGSFSLRPGLRYMDAGRLFDPSNATGFITTPDPVDPGGAPDTGFPDATGSVSDDHFVTYIEIPVDVRYQYDRSFISPYVLVGPVLRFATDTTNQDRLRTLSMAAAVGVGLEIRLAGLRFYPEVKRAFGISGFTNDEYEFADVVIRPDEQRLDATMVSIGIGF
ncbi:MAG: PorT family protein [Bacteroidetes bacterium SB0668_bin_1]|nr:PorT family protein [Bacteroidetes bacterium SB0668_bin_1]